MFSPTEWYDDLLVLHGLKRSGNHAVIGWLRNQKKTLIINNAFPIEPILRSEARDQIPCSLRSKIPWSLQIGGLVRGKRRILISIEDHRLDQRFFVDDERVTRNIVIVRDPINLFASRIRKASTTTLLAYPDHDNWIFQRTVQVWKQHCREALNLTDFLDNKIAVYFDQWLSDADYRRGIQRSLGPADRPSDLADKISSVGGGSSFADEYRHNEALLNRKSRLDQHELGLLSLVERDSELMELRASLAETAESGFALVEPGNAS